MRLRNIPAAKPAVLNSPLCIDSPEEHKGQWHLLFSNNNPIEIEIGMGKGQFLLTKAKNGTNVNYIGLERYESVMYRALQRIEALEVVPENLRMICCDAANLTDFFAKGEVQRIYLNFSDPWPKERHAKRRLTSARFLSLYEQVLSTNGTVEFKTDNVGLFDFSEETLRQNKKWRIEATTRDLHRDAILSEGNVMTEYEEKFSAEGKPIGKLIARLIA